MNRNEETMIKEVVELIKWETEEIYKEIFSNLKGFSESFYAFGEVSGELDFLARYVRARKDFQDMLSDSSYKECIKRIKTKFKKITHIDNRILQGAIEELESERKEEVSQYPFKLLGQYETYGIVLSALMNLSPEKEFHIKIEKPWDYLGMRNKSKKIVIEGKRNVGANIGQGMKGGEIVISKGYSTRHLGAYMSGGIIEAKKGAGDSVGRGMIDGNIIVEGDAGDYVGLGMKGGKIRIKGNVGGRLGAEMKGGEIIVDGNAWTLAGELMEGGTIIIKGKTDSYVGQGMKGGKIYVGEFEDQGELDKIFYKFYYEPPIAGEIYEGTPLDDNTKPKLVWKDGRFVSK